MGDKSLGGWKLGPVYDGLLQLLTLGEVSSYNPGGLPAAPTASPGMLGLRRGPGGVPEAQVWASSWSKLRLRPWLPQAQASLATTTCHPISFDAMAEPGAS